MRCCLMASEGAGVRASETPAGWVARAWESLIVFPEKGLAWWRRRRSALGHVAEEAPAEVASTGSGGGGRSHEVLILLL